MNKLITEYGQDVQIEGVTVVYQFTPKANFLQSTVTLLQVGSISNPEMVLIEKTKNKFKSQIIQYEAEKQHRTGGQTPKL